MITKQVARLRMLWPILRLGWRYLDDENAWRSLDYHVPVFQYGPGCVREFKWYLEGESRVTIKSVGALCRFLRGCRYVSDPELFHELRLAIRRQSHNLPLTIVDAKAKVASER